MIEDSLLTILVFLFIIFDKLKYSFNGLPSLLEKYGHDVCVAQPHLRLTQFSIQNRFSSYA